MKIVAGLGNPGLQYANTPHSVGFEVADALADAMGAVWEEKRSFSALVARGECGGAKTLVLKPQTYMNLSGEAVAPAVKYSNAAPGDLIVVQDDIDLPLGRVRVRKGGSCGGHNGIRNIIERLGSQAFVRVKIGVGRDRGDAAAHVLGKFPPAARETVRNAVARAAAAVECILREGPDKAMNLFNAREPA